MDGVVLENHPSAYQWRSCPENAAHEVRIRPFNTTISFLFCLPPICDPVTGLESISLCYISTYEDLKSPQNGDEPGPRPVSPSRKGA